MKTTAIAVLILSHSLGLYGGEAVTEPRYTAKAAIEYQGVVPPNAEKVFMDSLPRGDDSVTVRQIESSPVFEIAVTASSPHAAETRANQIALSLQCLTNDPDGSTEPVLIFSKARTAEASPQSK